MKNKKIHKTLEMYSLIEKNGMLLSAKEKEQIKYLYSSFTSMSEVINILLLNNGNSVSQVSLERFCLSLALITNDISNDKEIISSHIRSPTSLILWRMYFYEHPYTQDFTEEKHKLFLSKLKKMNEDAKELWVKKWPNDEKLLA